MKIKIFSNGFRFYNEKIPSVKCNSPSVNRGSVTCFSSHSRLRLRERLLSLFIEDSTSYGVTLTIPKTKISVDTSSSFRSVFHRFRTYFLRKCPRSGFIWRVELQKNKMPHLHLVSYIRSNDDVRSLFFSLWNDSVDGLFPIPDFQSFFKYSVHVSLLDNSIAAFRYISDHGSKRKQAQLGWRGRQWGIVGRSNFSSKDFQDFFLPSCLSNDFVRFVRKATSFSVKSSCVFGSRKIRRKGINAVNYLSSSSVRRWLKYRISQLCFCSCLKSLLDDDLPF